ncbi:hypothetical protein K523DRAFT_326222, partial [Schizophyllum commune Tattone D]
MSLNSQPRGGAKGISRNGRLTVEGWTQRREVQRLQSLLPSAASQPPLFDSHKNLILVSPHVPRTPRI